MRLALLLLLTGCPPGGQRPIGGGECFVDQECTTGEVCARDDFCYPAEDVHLVKAVWTIAGAPATEASCVEHPDLHIRFDGNVPDDLGFAPVPCAAGQFVIDKLPKGFSRVELKIDNGPFLDSAAIDASGIATLDLSF